MKKSPLFLIGGGLAGLGVFLAFRKSGETTDAIKDAVDPTKRTQLPLGVPEKLPVVRVHATGYWPFVAGLSAEERKMEGGTTDRKGNVLYTLEQFQAGKAPYVSVAGDLDIWPYGQRVSISAWPNVTFRVVDTGGHFHGVNKVYRVMGEEPLDICVDSSKTTVPKKDVTATIYPGDNFEKGKSVVASGFRGQNVVVSGEERARIVAAEAIVGAYYDSLKRGL